MAQQLAQLRLLDSAHVHQVLDEAVEHGGLLARRAPVRGDQLLERRRAVGEPADRLLEPVEHVQLQLALAHVAPAATLPRMPLTNRPASSPEKVLASSMDSLMAAFVGTCRSTVSSQTAIRRMTRSTFAICSSFQCSDASRRMVSSFSRLASTPRMSCPAKAAVSVDTPLSAAWYWSTSSGSSEPVS